MAKKKPKMSKTNREAARKVKIAKAPQQPNRDMSMKGIQY